MQEPDFTRSMFQLELLLTDVENSVGIEDPKSRRESTADALLAARLITRRLLREGGVNE